MFSKKRTSLLIFYLSIIALLSWIINTPNNPLTNLNVDEIIRSFVYPSEVHEVTTEDGYILTLNRIPYSLNNISNPLIPRIPVLLMHGIMQSAADYVLAGPEKSLALLLADKGFDVWLGNVRGNTWSRKHKSFNPDIHPEFWNFTIDEISVYDISGNIDYILNITNQSSLHYVGYSQGGGLPFITVSERPEYNRKIRLLSALSPVIVMGDVTHPVLKIMSNNVEALQNWLNYLNIFEIMSSKGFFSRFAKFICNGNPVLMYFCLEHLKNMQGGNSQLDKDSLPSLTAHFPAGMGTKHFVHCMQITKAGVILKFDYGSKVNMELYGQETPPEYDISKITAPIALYYSKSDSVVNITNMAKVENRCQNVVKSYKVPVDEFYHMDYTLGKNAEKVLYNSVIEEMLKY